MCFTAIKMLLHNKTRSVVTVGGITIAFFLSVAQVGLLVGWCNTNSAIICHAGVDVWVMAQQTPAFDYGTGIPKHRIHQVRTVPGVAWAQGMFMGWNYWQRPDGRRVNIEMIGLDEDCVGGPWKMQTGTVSAVQVPQRVIVDQFYVEDLGVTGVGDEVEILGTRAVVGAISTKVRTFTAAPWVFTSLESALKYDRRTDGDQITYVLVRCEPGHPPEAVRDAINTSVPGIEALTTSEFSIRTIRYWMLETGIGITVVVTAVLGLVVGTVIVSQTLYAITNDHLSDYATLLAIGFSRFKLLVIIVIQATCLGAVGICLGSTLFGYASTLSAETSIPLETTPLIFAGVVATTLLSCVAASAVSIHSVFRIDPIVVFRA
ncbi:MAG: FtsX-like permease family protein [Pirellulales bacterium]